MPKITGLDQLQKQLEDAQRGFRTLDGDIAAVRFNPNDQESVQAAIEDMESAIDRKVSSYRGNALVEKVVMQMKAKYRAAILDRANSTKVSSNEDANE